MLGSIALIHFRLTSHFYKGQQRDSKPQPLSYKMNTQSFSEIGQFGEMVGVLVYQLSGCGLESRGSQLNLRYRACFKQGVP